ncbi:MAG: hypothetical protein D6674_00255 [Acidobacteria bacterium]|jgi:hypothetical protein|nr:MAG: hypothetical protein D6674_00255 [Acidobacteriota bacterium]
MNTYYLNDEFVEWLKTYYPDKYSRLTSYYEKATTKRYGDGTGLQSGIKISFLDESLGSEFGNFLHDATLSFVNSENNLGLPSLPDEKYRKDTVFLTESFYRWLLQNDPENASKVTKHIKEKATNIQNINERNLPIIKGLFIFHENPEDKKNFEIVIHNATLNWLDWASKMLSNGSLNIIV